MDPENMDQEELRDRVAIHDQIKEIDVKKEGEEEAEETESEEEEEPKPIGHKATARWVEKGIPRTRVIPQPFHKKEAVARKMARNHIEEYAEERDKDIKDLEIELEPVYEKDKDYV